MTKIILMAVVFIFQSVLYASEPILVEIGEDYLIHKVHSKIWIEDAKIFSAKQIGAAVLLKAIHVGYSKIKIDQNFTHFYAVPAGLKESYTTWQKLVQKIPYIKLSFCQNTICLKGKILNFDDYIKIINLMDLHKSYIYLDLDMSRKLEGQVLEYINDYLRSYETKPTKIMFRSSPWKMISSSKSDHQKIAHTLLKIGLFTEDNINRLILEDNIKIEVKFFEIKKSLIRNLGIKWPEQYAAGIAGQAVDSTENLILQLNAAESSGDSKILASPTLICRSGKEAEFLAGGEIPIKIMNFKLKDIVWKKYGIQLKFKPLIDPLGQMSIEIVAEISTPDFSKAIDGIPTLYTNKVSSHFDLIQSKTIFLSGLIQNDLQKSRTGLPYLSQIPVLGLLFSSQSYLDSQTELVIMVKPSLMEN